MKPFAILICSMMLLATGCDRVKALWGSEETKNEMSDVRKGMEAKGQELLKASRQALADSRFDEARKHLNAIRNKYELALNAREEGILLLDSICLKEAQHDLQHIDSLAQAHGQNSASKAKFDELCEKIKFYHRKLKYDKEHKQTR